LGAEKETIDNMFSILSLPQSAEVQVWLKKCYLCCNQKRPIAQADPRSSINERNGNHVMSAQGRIWANQSLAAANGTPSNRTLSDVSRWGRPPEQRLPQRKEQRSRQSFFRYV